MSPTPSQLKFLRLRALCIAMLLLPYLVGPNWIEPLSASALTLENTWPSTDLALQSATRAQPEGISVQYLAYRFNAARTPSSSSHLPRSSAVAVLVLNTTFLVLITLWLSLVGYGQMKSHFADKNTLLNFIGGERGEFYHSLWLIMLLRGSFFLFATIPATCLIYVNAVPEETLEEFMGEGINFMLWISAIISSLSALTVIASTSELRHQHFLLRFFYRSVPILCLAVGTGTWLFMIVSADDAMLTMKYFLSALAMFGLTPISLTEIFALTPATIAGYTIISCVCTVMLSHLVGRRSSQKTAE